MRWVTIRSCNHNTTLDTEFEASKKFHSIGLPSVVATFILTTCISFHIYRIYLKWRKQENGFRGQGIGVTQKQTQTKTYHQDHT